MVKIHFIEGAWEEMMWYAKHDVKLLAKVITLLNDIYKDPFSGIGKPEALKGNLKGYWSRRITGEHRIVYKIENDTIMVFLAKGHYLDK